MIKMLDKKKTKKLIEEKVNELSEDIIKLRQDIHSYPELGYQEKRTTELMANLFSESGLEVKTGIAETGLVATLKGQEDGKTLVIKASMDAVPIEDKKDVAYASKIKNISHSCGHDVELAWHFATAVVIKEIKRKYGLKGNLKFLLQPNEERAISNRSAAYIIRSKGLIDDADYIIEIHPGTRVKNNLLPIGSALTTEGSLNALSERFLITAFSEGGHAGIETKALDLNYIISEIVVRINKEIGLKSKNYSEDCFARIPSTILEGSSQNSLATKATAYGTTRIARDDFKKKKDEIYEGLVKIVKKTAKDNNIPVKIEYYFPDFEEKEEEIDKGIILKYWQGPPPLYNDSKLIKLIENSCKEFGVTEFKKFRHSGGNDISFYSETTKEKKVPIANIALGSTKEKNPPAHHSPYFDVDKEVLPLGAKIMSLAAINILYENDT